MMEEECKKGEKREGGREEEGERDGGREGQGKGYGDDIELIP